MANLVYILCAITSLTCAIALLRVYFRTGVRFLMWTGLGFVGFTLNNGVLILDQIIYPDINFSLWRILPAFFGLLIMTFGVIWDTA